MIHNFDATFAIDPVCGKMQPQVCIHLLLTFGIISHGMEGVLF